ncbi:MAG: GNAT family N-acetyltransferase [Clostridia bacterium]|nr:GNAT family N-acetyltransferase [Clostridia bacterium]
MVKLLLHTCCAPCSVYCIEHLRKEDIEPTVYWFNPNIHPYMEYKQRRDCLREYTKSIGVEVIFEENYGLQEFCKKVVNQLEKRCQTYCYPVRLEQSAKYAKENGYDCFSTTLLVSPYQNHEMLVNIGNQMAQKYGIEFLYRDFRVGFREGQAKARELGLYMQKYCGCIFSEQTVNYDHKSFADKVKIQNKMTERKVRLGWEVPNLELKPYKNRNSNERHFIYDLKKEVYKKYVEKIYGEWNEENQQKLFARFMKENSKNIELIYLKDELIGFYNGKEKDNHIFEIENICVKPEYQNRGIGTSVLKEILFEHKEQNIKLQVCKINKKAIQLYEKMGFKKEDETNTCYIMRREI